MNSRFLKNEGFETLDLGLDKAEILLDSHDSDNRFSLMRYTMGSKSPGPGAHFHPEFDQIFLMEEGEVEFTIGDETNTLRPGDIAFVKKNDIHNVQNTSSRTSTYLMILSPGGFENFFREYSEKQARISSLELGKLLSKYGEHPIKNNQ